MEVKDKTMELKNKLLSGLKTWKDQRIDMFTRQNPRLIPVGKYIKRFFDNMIVQQDEQIDKMINTFTLFVCDEKGNYDLNMFTDDLISMVKTMDEMPFNLYSMRGTIGKGCIRLELPDNPFVSFFTGDLGAIKIQEDDFKALKEILLARP